MIQKMAGNPMVRFDLLQLRTLLTAAVAGIFAAILEAAAFRGIDGAGKLAFQFNAVFGFPHPGIGDGDSRQQCLGIGRQNP